MSADSKVSPFLVIMDTTLPALSLSSSGSSKMPLILSHRALGPDSVTLYFSSLPPPNRFPLLLKPEVIGLRSYLLSWDGELIVHSAL